MKKQMLSALAASLSLMASFSVIADNQLDTFQFRNTTDISERVFIVQVGGMEPINRVVKAHVTTGKIPLIAAMTGPVGGSAYYGTNFENKVDCPGMGDALDGTNYIVTFSGNASVGYQCTETHS